VAAAAATTIEGVSLLTDGPQLGDPFDVGLSPDGIEVRQSGQATRKLPWDHVSEWTIEAHGQGVLLTLRGKSSDLRLMIPRWTSERLDAVLRHVTSHTAKFEKMPAETTPEETAPEATTPERTTPEESTPLESTPGDGPARRPLAATAPERVDRSRPPARTTKSRTAAHARGRRRRTVRRVTWKAVVTIVLLALLATAVTLVLLQSAGIIDWGFLGPTA
jgi:hypothetical protein